MAAFATLDDFEVRKGAVGDEDEEAKVAALLDDASALIRDTAAGSAATWFTEEEEDPPPMIKVICIEAAYRAWSNPDALAQSVSADTSLSYVRGSSPDALFLTEREQRIVRRAAGLSALVSVTLVSPYSGDDTSDWPELPLD